MNKEINDRLNLLAEIIYLREINNLMCSVIANIKTKEEINDNIK